MRHELGGGREALSGSTESIGPVGAPEYPQPAMARRRLSDLMASIGLAPLEVDLRVASYYVGGIERLDELADARPRPDTVGAAWKTYLDQARINPVTAAQNSGSVIALGAIRENMAGSPSQQRRVRLALREYNLNWLGTWKEINLRWAGQLYIYASGLAARNDYENAHRVYLEAIEAWKVVQALDSRSSNAQRRNWRGMRGSARLWMARRAGDPGSFLLGADEDFRIAFDNGDQTLQHFALHCEVQTRLHAVTLEVSWLDAADALLDSADERYLRSPDLIAARADIMVQRGVLAAAERAIEIAPEDEAPPSTPAGEEALLQGDLGTRMGQPLEDLERAAKAFAAARALYTQALTEGVASGSRLIWTIHRGQASARLASILRLAGSSLEWPDRRRVLREAIEDLAHCEDPLAPIRGATWPTTIAEFVRAELRSTDPEDLSSMAQRVAKVLVYAEVYCVERAELLGRLRRLALELDLRMATQTADAARIHALVPLASEDLTFPLVPLIYAARVCAPLVAFAGGPGSGDHWRVVDLVVRRLEQEANSERSFGHQTFAASHGVTLLQLATSHIDTNLQTLQRMHDLARSLRTGVATPLPLARLQFARSAQRYSRALSRSLDPADRVDAIELLTESIAEYELVLRGGFLDRGELPWGRESPGVEGLDTAHEMTIGPAELSTDSTNQEDGTYTLLARVRSLLGEAHLRRDAMSPGVADLESAIDHLEASRSTGNCSHQVVGLLADAYYRLGRRKKNRAALRLSMSLKQQARELGSGPIREAFSVAASAATTLWELDGNTEDFVAAVVHSTWAASADPGWPWPLVQLAEVVARKNAPVLDLPRECPSETVTGLSGDASSWELALRGDQEGLLATACTKALATDEFKRSILGGRSRTFVLDDPHRLLSSTLILKPGTRESSESEASRLRDFAEYIKHAGLRGWVSAVQPLATATLGEEVVLATRRAAGETLAVVILRALLTDEPGMLRRAREGVERALKLLAHINSWRGQAPLISLSRALRSTRSSFARDLFDLGIRNSRALASAWFDAIPAGLPLVGKRDAHTENWLLSDRGEIVALDLEAGGWLPLGFEVAQLLEDTPLLEHLPGGRGASKELADVYLRELRALMPGFAEVPDAGSDTWRLGYACFALRRAVFLLSRGTRRRARDSSSSSRAAFEMWTTHALRLVDESGRNNEALSDLTSVIESAPAVLRHASLR